MVDYTLENFKDEDDLRPSFFKGKSGNIRKARVVVLLEVVPFFGFNIENYSTPLKISEVNVLPWQNGEKPA